MAAPEGNDYWRRRTTHGRKAIFTTPISLWEAALEYFDYAIENNKWYKQDFIRGGEIAGHIVQLETVAPFTLHGLTLFLGVNTGFWHEFKKSKTVREAPKANIFDLDDNDNAEDFSIVITRIEDIIFKHKFDGAAVNAFNANIISRDLGLIDKQQNTINVEQPFFPDTMPDENKTDSTNLL